MSNISTFLTNIQVYLLLKYAEKAKLSKENSEKLKRPSSEINTLESKLWKKRNISGTFYLAIISFQYLVQGGIINLKGRYFLSYTKFLKSKSRHFCHHQKGGDC